MGEHHEEDGVPEGEYNAGTVEQEPLSTAQKYVLVLVLSITELMVAMEQTVVTASLPQITAALGSADGYTWIGTAYLLATAAVITVYGKLSDIYGRKPMILSAMGFFLIGSAISGAAKDMDMLIGGRALQGVGSGGIQGLVHIIASDMIPLHQRGLFMGFIGTTWMVASCIGPLIGGALTQKGQWRWSFYLNLPIGGVALVAMTFILKIKRTKTAFFAGIRRIDFVGIVLSTAATCLLLLALDWGGTKYAWGSKIVICFLVFSGVLFAAFLVYEALVSKEPLMPLMLFTGRTKAFSLFATFFHSISLMGVVYYLPFLFQSVYSQTPIMASVYVLPEAVIMGLTSALGGIVINKTGRYHEMMMVGLGLTTAFIGLLSTLNPSSNVARRVTYPMLYGAPVGLNFQSFIISLQTRIEKKDIGVATSAQSFIRVLGLSVGIAIGGVAFQNKVTELAKQGGNETLEKLLSGNAPSSVNAIRKLPDTLKQTAIEYYSRAFQVMFYVMIGMAGAGFLCTLLIKQHSLRMQDEQEPQNQPSKTEQPADSTTTNNSEV
ncbi:hypothetical protein TRICI_005971 [Trichomonascus ciferrii]|uniref:Major facilitator superfamily (MFS) profile domain-containing protein n=1 Tax=Trichomonascus ciferrii TaxID=44093 RepID=A0A642UMW2_9ASCO|nr:hypothetical protein TRICI_005971 [Trichomonascus ciferrii]